MPMETCIYPLGTWSVWSCRKYRWSQREKQKQHIYILSIRSFEDTVPVAFFYGFSIWSVSIQGKEVGFLPWYPTEIPRASRDTLPNLFPIPFPILQEWFCYGSSLGMAGGSIVGIPRISHWPTEDPACHVRFLRHNQTTGLMAAKLTGGREARFWNIGENVVPGCFWVT